MKPPEGEPVGPRIADFEGEPTRRLEDWRWLWSTDASFPVRSHRGWLGRLIVVFKRLARPLVASAQGDLWARQRVFNLVLLEHLQRLDERAGALEERAAQLEDRLRQGLDAVTVHHDALFSQVDLKMDRYRRRATEHAAALRAALAASHDSPPARAQALAEVDQAARYVEFEDRFRGTRAEIGERLRSHLPRLEEKTPILDLGCGRGEALAIFHERGLEARGVDSSPEMVRHCLEQGLDVSRADALDELASVEPGSLGSVVSFHVVEHMEAADVGRLIDLAWRALRPGGLLLIETPNPVSLVVGASRFWIDPSHLRPIHPDSLRFRCQSAGFDPVEVVPLRRFEPPDQLPEIGLDSLSESESKQLAAGVNRLRDRLDDLLFGDQDYAIFATK